MLILSILSKFLGLIPGLSGLAASIASTVFDAKVKIVQAKTGTDRDVAVEIVKKAAIDSHESTERLKAIAGSAGLLALVGMFATPYALFIWKVIVWDKILGWGVTDPLGGDVQAWGQVIIASLFGSTGAVALGSMWFNRPQK